MHGLKLFDRSGLHSNRKSHISAVTHRPQTFAESFPERLYFRDMVISKRNTKQLTYLPGVLKCSGPDCRLIAHNVSVQDLKKKIS